jgi:hypothetical protein
MSSGGSAFMARQLSLTLGRGTEGSNPPPSSEESPANLTFRERATENPRRPSCTGVPVHAQRQSGVC